MKHAFLIGFLMLLATAAHAERVISETIDATSGTVTMETTFTPVDIDVVKISWTSDADGNVTFSKDLGHGVLLRVVTDPGATAPSINYDITALDEQGADIFAGGGSNRSDTSTEQFAPLVSTYVPMVIGGEIDFAYTNAGNAKQGDTVLYIKR